MSKKFLPERLKLPLTDPFHSIDEHNEELSTMMSVRLWNLKDGGS